MRSNKILILHGALGAASQFEMFKKTLETDADVILFNFPGHGGKPVSDEPFSFELFTGSLLHFLDEQKFDRVNIFGYSMGGYAALHLAKQYPEKVHKIFTLATKFDWNETTSQKEAGMLNPEIMEAKIPAFAKTLAERHAPADWRMVVNKTREMIFRLGRTHLEAKDFLSVKQSVTIGVGEKDSMVSIAESRAVAELLPDGKLIVFPGLQHPFEKADLLQLASAVRIFFKENE